MNRLREIRHQHGLTQFKLAKLSDVSPADISKIETGTIRVFPRWRQRIAEALGVPENAIFPKGAENDASDINGAGSQ